MHGWRRRAYYAPHALRWTGICSLLILVGSGWMAWQQKRQEALDETLHLIQLVTDSSAKLFDSQLLALLQAQELRTHGRHRRGDGRSQGLFLP